MAHDDTGCMHVSVTTTLEPVETGGWTGFGTTSTCDDCYVT